MNTDFNFYYSGMAETAPELHNSAGSSKLRLHLFGNQTDDRFAVAAKKSDKTSLNWFERKLYVLVPDPASNGTTFYKVNKNSLKKRFQITDKELTGVADQTLLGLIQKKHTDRLAWMEMEGIKAAHSTKDPRSPYSRIIDALVEAGIDPVKYKGIAFWTPGQFPYCFTLDGESAGFALREPGIPVDDRHNLRDYNKGEILTFNCYPIEQPHLIDSYNLFKASNFDGIVSDTNRAELLEYIRGENSPITLVNLDKDDMKEVMSEGKFPSKILNQLKDSPPETV